MATYVLLSTLTENGALTLTHNPGRIREVNGEVEQMGVKVVAQYALLGPYDFLTIVEAPDNGTVARVSSVMGSRGSIRIMSLGAIPIEAYIESMRG